MNLLVVDASVVIKWFVPEVHTDQARRLLEADFRYVAPDLLFAEMANTVWKKTRRGELSEKDATRLVRDFDRIAVETVPCRVLAADAHALAQRTACTVYDAVYLALAVRLETRFVTADDRLCEAVKYAPRLAAHIAHVQELDPAGTPVSIRRR